jgi:hypothetical protein
VLTGSCKAAMPADAKSWDITGAVKGDTVAFSHGGDYEGTPLTMSFSGRLTSPAQIAGNVDVAPFDVGGTFSAAPISVAPAPVAPTAKP